MVYVVPEPGPPDPEFAAQLVRARKRAMLTQKELAEKMRDAGHSWHQNTVSRIENAVQHVTIKELVSLQEITGADPSLTASLDSVMQGFNADYVRKRGAIQLLREARESLRTADRAIAMALEAYEGAGDDGEHQQTP